ncbi:hypothetical protein HNP93_001431 [Methanococcus maripaludis]|uniref:Uncharacterized protein n=1 Tax=Methanococcus maripaludis TaxID=39152 RepID=A0A7J9P7E8_METMI|nr:hypothetical protein [Methanococcus maripaludis]MBA2858730.1 hypothetical protein [Methanococcus maripaludis]
MDETDKFETLRKYDLTMNAVTKNMDIAEKLYINTSDSLKGSIKFIYWYYATIFTAMLAILNFSGFSTANNFEKILYMSNIVLYFSLATTFGKSLIFEIIKEYSLKELSFYILISSKKSLEDLCDIKSLSFEGFQKKSNQIVLDTYGIYLYISWVAIVLSIFLIIIAIWTYMSMDGNKIENIDLIDLFWALLSFLISIILIYTNYKKVKPLKNNLLDFESKLYSDTDSVPEELITELTEQPKINKKLVVSAIFLILIGIYIKMVLMG